MLDDQDVDFIATGPASQHALFVCADGKCWGIGKNSSSQLGIQVCMVPFSLGTLLTVKHLEASN